MIQRLLEKVKTLEKEKKELKESNLDMKITLNEFEYEIK